MNSDDPWPFYELRPVERGKPDNLLVCSTGVEGASVAIAKEAFRSFSAGDYDFNYALILRYLQNSPKGDKLESIRYLERMRFYDAVNFSRELGLKSDGLEKKLASNVFSCGFWKGKPDDNIHELGRYSRILTGNITIDITSLMEEDLISLLYLVDKPGNNVRLVYTEPVSMPWTHGILKSGVVPGFIGDHQSDGRCRHVGVIFAGYSKHGAREYVLEEERVRARDTYLFIASPSFCKGWSSASVKFNDHLLYRVKVKEVSGLSPLAVKSELEKIYDSYPMKADYSERWFMGVAPVGTKWQAVGTYLFVRDKLEDRGSYEWSPVSVYYATPIVNNPSESYSGFTQFTLPKKKVRS